MMEERFQVTGVGLRLHKRGKTIGKYIIRRKRLEEKYLVITKDRTEVQVQMDSYVHGCLGCYKYYHPWLTKHRMI